MDIEIVPDRHIAGFELWRQLGGHISVESLAIDGAPDHPGRHQFMAAQPGDEGPGIPFAEGRICKKPLALDAASPKRGHTGFNRSLVDEHQPCGLCPDRRQVMFVPFFAPSLDIGAFFLRCQKCFFYM